MTAINQHRLHLRLVLRPHLFTRHQFFSSSDSVLPSDIPPGKSESGPVPKPSFSSYFNEVKATLQRDPPSSDCSQNLRKPLLFFNSPETCPPSKSAYLDEIRRNLSGFRSRSAAPPPSSTSGQSVSLQEVFRRDVSSQDQDSATSSTSFALKPPIGGSFDSIKDSLQKLRSTSISQSSQMPLSPFRESLNLKPGQNADPVSLGIQGGSDDWPSFFRKGKNAGEDGSGGSKSAMKTGFVRTYNYSDLGTKLKMLRPKKKKKGKWFSLQELNERLAKMREMDEKEGYGSVGGIWFKDLRETVVKLAQSDEEKKRMKTMQRLDILGQLGGTPDYMLFDPKDQLVEKYFHPDNMSTAEKLKLELKKVRDEFKMSESDCGSARVQVAQLTTKINHLSSLLHKKDKHSRRGLLAMVQRRKKLLKYLRRTDWDSYCLVLSKLGLRDSPDSRS